jgi:Bacterial Ig domain
VSSLCRVVVRPLPMRSLAVCLAVALGAASAAPLSSPLRPQGTIVVTNCSDSGPGSLRDAVQGDTLGVPIDLSQLSCSTITLTSGAIVAFQPLTLIGPGSSNLSIDGNHHDAVFVEGAAGATLSVQGMTVQNGYVIGYGGCIFSAGPVVIDDVIVTGCDVAAHGVVPGQVFTGGGIEARGNFTATDSRIVGNALNVSTAFARGGGIHVGGDATLVNTTVSENLVNVIASFGLGNYEFADGGGMFVEGNVWMTRSTISDNTASSVIAGGGAGLWSNGYLSMAYSSVSGNTAENGSQLGCCGGMYVANGVEIDRSTVSGNTAGYDGAIVTGYLSLAFVKSSTVSGNTASFDAGIVAYNLFLYNSTVAFNIETNGGYCAGICMLSTAAIFVGSSIVADNLSGNNEQGNIGTVDEHLYVVGQNSVIGPCRFNVELPDDTITLDPMLAPLSDNGGPTLTHALLEGSPAINMGVVLNAGNWDQRGEGYPRTIGGAPDIGAFEAPLPDQPPTAVDDGYATFENATLTVAAPGLLANDSDADGDALAAVLVDDVSHGALTLNADGSLVYVPAPNFFGTDGFTYEATDGEATSNLATVTIEVLEVVSDVVFANGFE